MFNTFNLLNNGLKLKFGRDNVTLSESLKLKI